MTRYPQASTLVPGSRRRAPLLEALHSPRAPEPLSSGAPALSSASPSVGPISSQEAWGPW